MPANVVKTPKDERHWNMAKQAAAKQGRTGDYAYIMGIYQKMNKGEMVKASALATGRTGPGSRGGKVIGHCASGKPVYQHGPQSAASYTHADHADAADIHAAHAQLSTGDKRHHHQWMAGYHSFRAQKTANSDGIKKALHKAAGDRGGVVIGRTKSGRPIYQRKGEGGQPRADKRAKTAEGHAAAADKHQEQADQHRSQGREHLAQAHETIAHFHRQQSQKAPSRNMPRAKASDVKEVAPEPVEVNPSDIHYLGYGSGGPKAPPPVPHGLTHRPVQRHAGFHMHASFAKSALNQSASGAPLHIGEPDLKVPKATIPAKPKQAIVVGRDKAGGRKPFVTKEYKDNANPTKPPSEDRAIFGKSKTDGNPSEPDDAPPQYANQIRGKVLAQKVKEEMASSMDKAIARTQSDKPIYSPNHDSYSAVQNYADSADYVDGKGPNIDWLQSAVEASNPTFTADDHNDAAAAQTAYAESGVGKVAKYAEAAAMGHAAAADSAKKSMAASNILSEFLSKAAGGGAGSRGGHIIGHTKSGKPIYGNKHPSNMSSQGDALHDQHANYTSSDHHDAALAHMKAAYSPGTKKTDRAQHSNLAEGHKQAATRKGAREHLQVLGTKNAAKATKIGSTAHGPVLLHDSPKYEAARKAPSGQAGAEVKAAFPKFTAEDHEHAGKIHQANNVPHIANAHFDAAAMKRGSTEKSMNAASILMDYLAKSHGGHTVAECAELSPDYAETTTGKDPSDVFPHKNQKVSPAEDDSGLTTYPSNAPVEVGLREDGFSGFETQETSPGESMRDLGAGRGEAVPEAEPVFLNPNDANKIGNKERHQAFERSMPAPSEERVIRKGLLEFHSNTALDNKCANMVKGNDFYFGEAPSIVSPMGQHYCRNRLCKGPIPNFLTACPHCGTGQVLHKCFGESQSPYATEAMLASPTAAQDYCPNGIRFK